MTLITTDWLAFANASQSSTDIPWFGLDGFNFQGEFDLNNTSTYSDCEIGWGEITNRVRLWGVTLPASVPSNATLVGIEVRVFNDRSDYTQVADDLRRLMIGTIEVGSNLALASTWVRGATDDRISGGPSNMWDSGLTKSDIGANFGFRFRAVNTGAKSGEVYSCRAAVRFTFEEAPILVRVGSLTPDRLYLDGTEVTSAYLGSDRVL